MENKCSADTCPKALKAFSAGYSVACFGLAEERRWKGTQSQVADDKWGWEEQKKWDEDQNSKIKKNTQYCLTQESIGEKMCNPGLMSQLTDPGAMLQKLYPT